MWVNVYWILLLIFTVVIMGFGIARYYRNKSELTLVVDEKSGTVFPLGISKSGSAPGESGKEPSAAAPGHFALARSNRSSSKAASILNNDLYDCCMNDLSPGLQNSTFTIHNVDGKKFSKVTIAQDPDSPLYSSTTAFLEGSDDETEWYYIGEYVLTKNRRVSVIHLNREYRYNFVRVRSSDRDDEQIRYWKICQFKIS